MRRMNIRMYDCTYVSSWLQVRRRNTVTVNEAIQKLRVCITLPLHEQPQVL
jgi:hypothetical protein